MRKRKLAISDLIKKNREELLKDKGELEKIEQRIDEKHIKLK